ncbi:DNA polymerase III subunit delta [Aliidiomarina sedimenti]|uniref:DNA polymerase III subunit delta n=1 Tax=Aliidiomarina sedimenti TaxID=1933879 RepID=A0ABY0C2W8_9GAMM|nr:DNA polymerase III subunit delta [Aliidiomarina sedimenti]RUO32152.1 DNA polymerase III subunit delta [Aliidiomarina sedimenti]
MQVYANQLDNHLQGPLQPVYLVFGDDDFLRLRALAAIRKRAAELGFNERSQFNQQQDFSWQDLLNENQNLSLFSDLRLIEVEMPTAAPGQDGSKALQQWVDSAQDALLIIHGPKLKADQQKAKWFKALTQQGVFVPVYTPQRSQLPGFIQQLAQSYGLQLDGDATALLSDWFEGNLLALDQALHKIALHYCQVKNSGAESSAAENTQRAPLQVSAEMVRQDADLQSRFDVFSLQDAILQGQFNVYLQRLQRLLETDGEPAIIHWLLQRETNTLNSVYQQQTQGEDTSRALQRHGVWKSQQHAYLRILKDWSPARSEALFNLLWRAELALKRDSGEDMATLFAHLGLLLIEPPADTFDFLRHHDLVVDS